MEDGRVRLILLTNTKEMNKEEKAFNQHRLNGFSMYLPNGNWISTVWGDGTYSDNHNYFEAGTWNETKLSSDTVEIMIKCPEKLLEKIHKKYDGDGQIIGYLTFSQWLEIIKLLSK